MMWCLSTVVPGTGQNGLAKPIPDPLCQALPGKVIAMAFSLCYAKIA